MCYIICLGYSLNILLFVYKSSLLLVFVKLCFKKINQNYLFPKIRSQRLETPKSHPNSN